MKRIKKSTLRTKTEKVADKEKLPVKWWIANDETKVSADGITIMLKYRPDIGNEKTEHFRCFEFPNEKLDAIRAKDLNEDNPLGKVALIHALVRGPQSDFRERINRQMLELYHNKGMDAAVGLFAENADIEEMLQGFACVEAKIVRMHALAR